MHLEYTPEQDAFRAEVRAWMEAHVPKEPLVTLECREGYDQHVEWERTLASGNWGSLASFGARQREGTKRWYGDYGNSFVAVVRFGKDGPEARAVHAGGLSSNPASPHFRDQAERYRTHDFRTVYFTDAQLQGHVEKMYRPGE